MKRLLLSASTFLGVVDYEFNDAGKLIKFDATQAVLDNDNIQIDWLLNKMPKTLPDLLEMVSESKNFKLQHINFKLTFDMLWDRYNDKVTSSKKRALVKWEKMTEDQQFKAYFYIPTYFSSLGNGVRKKYLETYLNSELWNN